MALYINGKRHKVNLGGQIFTIHSPMPKSEAYTLTITWGAGVSNVTVARSESPSGAPAGWLNSGDILYPGDVLSITAVPMTGYTLTTEIMQTITVTGDTSIDIAVTTPPSAILQQELKLPSGDMIGVTFTYDADNLFEFSADIPIEPIWENCHFGTTQVQQHPGMLNSPIEIYNIDIGYDVGYMTGYPVGDPGAEAEYIREHGTYLGSIWVDADMVWRVGIRR